MALVKDDVVSVNVDVGGGSIFVLLTSKVE